MLFEAGAAAVFGPGTSLTDAAGELLDALAQPGVSDPARPAPPASAYVAGVLAGDRTWLARAVTLVESTLPADRSTATEVLERLAPHAADAHRVGVTGPPGAGKSTLIDALGMYLCEQGHRVAVLAVDPSSAVSGGSILGDKTRMALLASAPEAFVRPVTVGRGAGRGHRRHPGGRRGGGGRRLRRVCSSRPSAWASRRPAWPTSATRC